jgi:hypothetical protein
MAPVHQNRELDGGGPAQVLKRVKRGPDGAPREEHVIDEHHPSAIYPAGRFLRAADGTHSVLPQVVTVEGDIERAHRDGPAFEGGNPIGEPLGQRNTPGRYAQKNDVSGALGLLKDLMGDSVDDSLQLAVGKHSFRVRQSRLLPRLTGRVIKGSF